MPKPKAHVIQLTAQERAQLEQCLHSGRRSARSQTHARILLKADTGSDGPGWLDSQICEALEVSPSSVYRVRKRFAQEGLSAALNPRISARPRRRLLDGEQEARLVALACSSPPEGRARWTLHLLADRMVTLEYVESISYETVRRTLKKTSSSPI
jgi:transposase